MLHARGTPGAGRHDRGNDSRHLVVHESRAGAWQTGGQALGCLGVRLRALRDAGGHARVSRRHAVGHRCGRPRARAGVVRAACHDAAEHPAGPATMSREGSDSPAARYCRRADRNRGCPVEPGRSTRAHSSKCRREDDRGTPGALRRRNRVRLVAPRGQRQRSASQAARRDSPGCSRMAWGSIRPLRYLPTGNSSRSPEDPVPVAPPGCTCDR